MDVRCQNCGERLVLPSAKPTDTSQEIVCHSCGVSMSVHLPTGTKQAKSTKQHGHASGVPRPTEVTWKRVFEPLPRVLTYSAGIVLAALLLSPFWVTWLQERYTRTPILLSDDTEGMPLPKNSRTNATLPIMSGPEQRTSTLDQFHDIRLESKREDAQRTFNLRPLNTRGMEPEIYEATKLNGIDRLTGYFYGGVLKEVFVICREQRGATDLIQKDLLDQFGPPAEQTETTTPTGTPSLRGLGIDEASQRITEFAFHRNFIWNDAHYRVEAAIHYTSADPSQNRMMLTLQMSAAGWLKSRSSLPSAVTLPMQ